MRFRLDPKKLIIHICLPLLSFPPAYTSDYDANKKYYQAVRLNVSAPKIDGFFDDEAWEEADWEEGFVQLSPYPGKSPSQNTSFKMIYDNDNLYIAIKAFDSAPDSIVRRMSRRDEYEYEGDWVGIDIDSYFDKRTAFSFNVNAAGVKGDEAITNDNNFDSSWDPIWHVKTSTDDLGWNAEMQIPLTQLRFGSKENHIWGLQVVRWLFRKEERSAWQFISPNASGWVHNFGELNGINNIVPKKQKDITPYVVGKLENYERDGDNPFSDGRDVNGSIGVDGKFGITNNLTLDFTLNPDFGQVEADPSEVNLSTFETFFPERRAFFIEGKNILSHRVLGGGGPLSSDNLFYSRRIGRNPGYSPDLDDDEYAKIPKNTTILGAFKLTGKTPEGWSIGIMESLTQKEIADIDKDGDRYTTTVEPLTNYFAARLERDFNNSNTQLGAMFTATNRDLTSPELVESMHRSAYSGGFNFNHQWKNKTYYLNLIGVFSTVNGSKEAIQSTQTSAPHYFQRPDAKYFHTDSIRTSLSGHGGTFQIGKAGNGKISFTNWITWRSPGLNLNDMGYMKRNDEIQQLFWIGYNQNEAFSIFRSANINFNQWSGFTFGADTRYYGGEINGGVQFKNYWRAYLGGFREGKGISTETLRGGPALVNNGYSHFWTTIQTDYRKKVASSLSYSSGARDGRTDNSRNVRLDVHLRISDALKLTLQPVYNTQRDEIAHVKTLDDRTPKRYIRGEIDRKTTSLTVRLTYNITPDFTIQYYAMPFISAGKYKNFKHISNSKSENFGERFTNYTNRQLSFTINDEGEKTYEVDENRDGTVDYSFDNPDFKVMDFNSNLVIRWEYRPGSTVFLVWSQNRNKQTEKGNYSFKNDVDNLFTETYPHDVFLFKLSYRIGL